MSESTGGRDTQDQEGASFQSEQADLEHTGQSSAASHGEANKTESKAPQSEVDILRASLENAHKEVEKNRESYLRLAADMENLRRRAQEDVAKAHKFAIESFAESLLPVRDSLESALNVQAQTSEALLEGVSATLRILESCFEKGKIQAVNPVGEKFDPNAHQAVSMVPGNSVEPAVPTGHIVTVLQRGYLINERMLRPALVIVAQ